MSVIDKNKNFFSFLRLLIQSMFCISLNVQFRLKFLLLIITFPNFFLRILCSILTLSKLLPFRITQLYKSKHKIPKQFNFYCIHLHFSHLTQFVYMEEQLLKLTQLINYIVFLCTTPKTTLIPPQSNYVDTKYLNIY